MALRTVLMMCAIGASAMVAACGDGGTSTPGSDVAPDVAPEDTTPAPEDTEPAADVADTTPTETASPIRVKLLHPDPVGSYCVSLTVARDGDAAFFSAGTDVTDPATPEAAAAAGALCGAGEIDTGARCRPGSNTANVRLLGMWGQDGTRLQAGTDYQSACPEDGCSYTIDCDANPGEPKVIQLVAYGFEVLGFFDISFEVEPPAGAPELCYGFRLVDGAGEAGVSRKRVCSSEYGNGEGGFANFVAPCDAADAVRTYGLTWWVHPPEIEGAEAWTHPCSVPADAPDDIFDWTGGCATTAVCVDGVDTGVRVGDAAE